MNESQVVLSLLYSHQLGNLGDLCLKADPCLRLFSYLSSPYNMCHISQNLVVSRLRHRVILYNIWQAILGHQNDPLGYYHSGIWV